MTLSPENRKVGINVSVPFKYIKDIDQKSEGNRSKYIWKLICNDLGIDERNN